MKISAVNKFYAVICHISAVQCPLPHYAYIHTLYSLAGTVICHIMLTCKSCHLPHCTPTHIMHMHTNMLTGSNCHLPQYAYQQELSSATLHTYTHFRFTGRNQHLPYYANSNTHSLLLTETNICSLQSHTL